jgi:ANTAR domain
MPSPWDRQAYIFASSSPARSPQTGSRSFPVAFYEGVEHDAMQPWSQIGARNRTAKAGVGAKTATGARAGASLVLDRRDVVRSAIGYGPEAGFRRVEALPMRLRDQVIGALNLFRVDPAPFDPAELRIGQALADVATIGLLHERNVRRTETVAEQLQRALNSRVVIEQAKGKLAERLGMDMDQAFGLLRDYARNSNQRLTDVAANFVDSATADFPPPPCPWPAQSRN